jgi:hypothetical protein
MSDMEQFPDEGADDQFSTPHQLCEKCQHVASSFSAFAERLASEQTKAPTQEFDHYDNLASLIESASRGCHLCSIFASVRGFFSGKYVYEDVYNDYGKVRVSIKFRMGFSTSRCAHFQATLVYGEKSISSATVHRHLKKASRSTMFTQCESALEMEAEWPEETRYGMSTWTGSRVEHDLFDK